MELLKQFKLQQQKFKKKKNKQYRGRYNFKDDDPVEPFDFTKLQNKDLKYSLQNQLKFTMTPMKDIIKAKAQGTQVIPFVCSLKAADAVVPDQIQQENKDRAPIDLICVLDISGSMAGAKINLLQETVNFIVDTLSERDRISIVQFNDRARRLIPLKRLTQKNQPGIFDKIANIKAKGGTNIAAGDIVRGASLVVWAIKDGRDAAKSIKIYLENLQKQKIA